MQESQSLAARPKPEMMHGMSPRTAIRMPRLPLAKQDASSARTVLGASSGAAARSGLTETPRSRRSEEDDWKAAVAVSSASKVTLIERDRERISGILPTRLNRTSVGTTPGDTTERSARMDATSSTK